MLSKFYFLAEYPERDSALFNSIFFIFILSLTQSPLRETLRVSDLD